MHARVTLALKRVAADFAGLPVDPPTFDGAVVQSNGVHIPLDAPGGYEELTSVVAYHLQDAAMDELGRTWPEVGGRPLFPSADSGVACWCLDGKPWCAVGQLSGALAVVAEAEPAG